MKIRKQGICCVDIAKYENGDERRERKDSKIMTLGPYIACSDVFSEKREVWDRIHFETVVSRRYNHSKAIFKDLQKNI